METNVLYINAVHQHTLC